jgi:ATP-binding cassette, subfamily B, bacterial
VSDEPHAASEDAGPSEGSPSHVPPSWDDLAYEAQNRPKSIRLLPRICRDAVRLVWAASPSGLIASVALKMVSGVGLAAALLVGRDVVAAVLDAGNRTGGIETVVPALIGVVAIIAGLGLVAAAGREVREVLSEITTRHAKQRIIDVTTAVELSAYETPTFHDRLVRAATGEYRPIQMVDGLIGTVGALASIGGIMAALLAIQPWLVPLLLVAGVPLMGAVLKAGHALFGFHMRMTPVTRARNYLYGLLTAKDPAKELRAFSIGPYLNARHAALYDEHMTELRRTSHHRFRIAVASTLVLAAALGAGIAGLLYLALSDRLGLAETATAAGALLILGERMMMTVIGIGQVYESGLFVEDYTTFLATAPTQHATTGTQPAPETFERITVTDVTFTYPAGTRPALRGVNLELQAGQIVALVGDNGSGKTTLAKLLARLYLPQSGSIRWDGADTAQIDPDQLRRRIAVIFQDFLHYALPARQNIGLGAIDRIDDHDAIRAAARRAGADQALSRLPDGYETILSPEYAGGRDLSIGQWQRVALARAFMRDAPLIILDEPTAALDARAENELFASIRTMYAGRTVLFISHRFNTVRVADHIYVLNDGQIVEDGDHDTLIALGGLYAELFTLQAAAYTTSSTPPLDSTI